MKLIRPAKNERKLQIRLAAAGLLLLPVLILVGLLARIIRNDDIQAEANNDAINQRNFMCARGNRFGFTDREHSTAKPKGIFRIAVMGDSFIWGDGIPYEKAWSHKLEKVLTQKYDSIEVLHWGLNGWSTLDEYNFFKEHGRDFDIDLLIIGWVDNDADVGKLPQVAQLDPAIEYPTLFKISPGLAQAVLIFRENVLYGDWVSRLYSDENLKDYQQVLDSFEEFLHQNKVNTLVVLTPGVWDKKWHSERVQPLLRHAGFTYFDLNPIIRRERADYPSSDLQASRVNGHPGEIMTGIFAREVAGYLIQNNYLVSVPKKRN